MRTCVLIDELVFLGELPPQPDHITAIQLGNVVTLLSCTPLKRSKMGIATGSDSIVVTTADSSTFSKKLAASESFIQTLWCDRSIQCNSSLC